MKPIPEAMSPRSQALMRALLVTLKTRWDYKEILADMLIGMISLEDEWASGKPNPREGLVRRAWTVEIIRMQPPAEVLRALGM